MQNVKKITNQVKIGQLNVQGQGCGDDCTEHNKLVGKTDANISGCVIYDTIYTPKKNWFS